MTYQEAFDLLQDFESLQRAHLREAWAPLSPPPPATLEWYAASHLLLAAYRRLLEEGLGDGRR